MFPFGICMSTKIGIFGGSGFYNIPNMEKKDSIRMATPYGMPSSSIDKFKLEDKEIYFIARHGINHEYPAHVVNYRANIYAFKSLGVERIISIQTVGSLKEEYSPGTIVIPDQFVDFTKKRDYSFYNGGKSIHISMADPFCPELRNLAINAIKGLDIKYQPKGNYVCIEGPRFSTRAESHMFRSFADIIGMTLVPEAILARELEMCYLSIATVTDYDSWKESHVTAEEVTETMKQNVNKTLKILEKMLPAIPKNPSCSCHTALKDAEI